MGQLLPLGDVAVDNAFQLFERNDAVSVLPVDDERKRIGRNQRLRGAVARSQYLFLFALGQLARNDGRAHTVGQQQPERGVLAAIKGLHVGLYIRQGKLLHLLGHNRFERGIDSHAHFVTGKPTVVGLFVGTTSCRQSDRQQKE